MYRIGVLVNDNEAAHSPFADTTALLRRVVNRQILGPNNYRFLTFDKSNISSLFATDSKDAISHLDALFIATNATNNIEILQALQGNREMIHAFIRRGGGLVLTAQKKLGSSPSPGVATDFLPEPFECQVIRRPEQSSFAGDLQVKASDHRLLNYPNVVSKATIDTRCEFNRFAPHKYRSFLAPKHPTMFVTLIADVAGPDRPLFLCSKNPQERVLVTSMAIDWAEHEELIQNCLLYVTEGIDQTALLRKRDGALDGSIDSYVTRARAAKVPLRQYQFDELFEKEQIQQHSNFILSPDILPEEADAVWGLAKPRSSARLYHLRVSIETGEHYLLQRFRGNGLEAEAVPTVTWITGQFMPGIWGKSVWTYNYTLSAFASSGVSFELFAEDLFKELTSHFRRDGDGALSYDSVPNATAQMLEVLSLLRAHSTIKSRYDDLEIDQLIQLTRDWLAKILESPNQTSPRDKLYAAMALMRSPLDSTSPVPDVALLRAVEELCTAYGSIDSSTLHTSEVAQVLGFSALAVEWHLISQAEADVLIESTTQTLINRQSVWGAWRSVSETAEVALHLLSALKTTASLEGIAHESLLLALDYIYSERERATGSWSHDLNASALALRCVAEFDAMHDHRGDGFFQDLLATSTKRVEAEANLAIFEREAATLGDLNKANEALVAAAGDNTQLTKLITKVKKSRHRLVRTSIALAFVVVLSLAAIGTILLELGSTHPKDFLELVSGWREYLVAGFIGVLVTALVTVAFNGLRSAVRAPNEVVRK